MFDFVDGGAEDELTLAANRAAFERVRLRPRVLVDVERVDGSAELLGRRAALPLAVAPTGMAGVAWPRAELAIACAAARRGVPYTLATPASSSIEEVAREAGERLGARLWFQLYVLRDTALVERLIGRALACGYEALVVTVDLAAAGKRERDTRNGLALPLRLTRRNLFDVLAHPRWLAQVLRHGLPRFANLEDLDARAAPGAIAALVAREMDASLDWPKIARLRERWPRKLVLKGILHPADAERALAVGADALVVSNHGGRQLDGALASLEALPAVVAAVRGRIPVLVDGGVRRGSDLAKARLYGAQAAMIGRATLYGVAAGGEAGALRALEILADEYARCLRLLGVRATEELSADLAVAPPGGA